MVVVGVDQHGSIGRVKRHPVQNLKQMIRVDGLGQFQRATEHPRLAVCGRRPAADRTIVAKALAQTRQETVVLIALERREIGCARNDPLGPFGSDARKEDQVITLVEEIENGIGPIEVFVFNINTFLSGYKLLSNYINKEIYIC